MKRRSFLALLGLAPAFGAASVVVGSTKDATPATVADGKCSIFFGDEPISYRDAEIRIASLSSEDGRFIMTGDRIVIR